MKEILQEIFYSMKSNKLRTFLTGFAISWGIFMLIVLLGVGNGFRNGSIENMRYMQENTMRISGSSTSLPYKGMAKGRMIRFGESDSVYFNDQMSPHVVGTMPERMLWSQQFVYGRHAHSGSIQGVMPELGSYKYFDMLYGRFINTIDIRENRKVLVLNEIVAGLLLRGVPLSEVVGKWVKLQGISFRVVGVYANANNSAWSETFLPYSTMKQLFSREDRLSTFSLLLDGVETKESAVALTDLVRQRAAYHYHFDPNDRRGVWVRNMMERYFDQMAVSRGLQNFVWLIGLCSLMSGIVGVGNIMMISVKERTREFGIRKALGARTNSILGLVLIEAVVITSLFGYIGMVLGIGLLELINQIVQSAGNKAFDSISVDISTVLQATLLLIASGVLAGFIPAKRAVSIRPIDAMRG